MTIPPLDHQFPLCAKSLPPDRLPAPGADATPLFLALVRQAFSLVRSSQAWKRGKVFGEKDDPKQGGPVQSLYCPSDMNGRLKKCGWHARLSRHNPSRSGLTFEDFYEGFGTDQHTLSEAAYIPDIIQSTRVTTVIQQRAEIWRNSYKLPSLTSHRDFVELVVTLSLPPSPEPFSGAHEEVVTQQLSSQNAASIASQHPAQQAAKAQAMGAQQQQHSRRSFVIISVPLTHPDAPVRQGQFVRAKHCSVEAVWEASLSKAAEAQSSARSDSGPHRDVEWLMAVQSDLGGRIPLVFQEVAMAGKISADVSLFFRWAREQKSKGRLGSAQSAAAPVQKA